MIDLVPNPMGRRDDPDVAILDFDQVLDRCDIRVDGTAKDLIRDCHGNSLQWLHNAHAQPDDRRVAFLAGRGWSATPERRKRIAEAGIPVMAINDYPKDGPKPRYWCAGDGPSYYGERVWTDPDVMKFCPIAYARSLRPREDAYAPEKRPQDAPNTNFFHHCNNEVDYDSWLFTPWVTWGNTIWGEDVPPQFYNKGSARSSMLIGLRVLWHLGYRRVALVGCDCCYSPYPQYWPSIFHMLEQLRPVFDRYGYEVVQTNRDSHLRCFDFMDFDAVLKDAEPTVTLEETPFPDLLEASR